VRCGPQPLSPNFWGGEHENELGVKYAQEGAKLWHGQGRPFEIRMSHVVPTALNEPTQLGAFFTRDVSAGDFVDFFARCMLDRDAVLVEESSHVRRVSNLDKVLDGGPLARCFVRYIAADEAGLAKMRALPASAFMPSREELGDLQYSRFLQMAAGCMINSPKHSGKPANVSMSGRLELGVHLSFAGVAKLTANRDARKGEELLGWYHNEEERHMERQDDHVASAASASAAAAASEPEEVPIAERSADAEHLPLQCFGRAHVSDRNAVIMSMEELPSVTVKWLDIHPDDYVRLKLGDQSHWDKLHAKHPTMAAAAADAARITKPEWLVNLFEGTRYSEVYKSKDQKKDEATLLPSSFIYWGEPAEILTKANKLVKPIWQLVREDLTEQKVERATRQAAPRSKAKPRRRRRAAAAAAAEAATVELEVLARRPPSGRAAAASATAANQAAAAAASESEPEEDASQSSSSSSSSSSDAGSSSSSSSSSDAGSSDDSDLQPLNLLVHGAARRPQRAKASGVQGKRPRSDSDSDDPPPSSARPATRASHATKAAGSKKKKAARRS
jgi:hypothetical protein